MEEKNEGLVQKLMDKYNIAIETFDNNFKFGLIAMTSATVLLLATPVIMTTATIVNNVRYANYLDSTVVCNDKEYQMDNVYVVYNDDNTYFCTRELQNVTEDGRVNSDEIHDYFDIRTGHKICSDYENGFYIAGLLDFYSASDMNGRNYQINLDEVSANVNIDSLSSRNPVLKRK